MDSYSIYPNKKYEVMPMFLGMIPDRYDSFGHRIVRTVKGEQRFVLSIKEIKAILAE